MNNKLAAAGAALVFAACGTFGAVAQADDADLGCKMKFSIKGWSLIYKTASGHGTVNCSDGSTLKVRITSEGGGLTVGKSSIDDGHADFTGVKNIHDVLGDYAAAAAHGAAVKSAAASVLTKGEVSMALSGTGRGWDVGVDFNKFTLSESAKK